MLSTNDLKEQTDNKKVYLDINCDLAQSFGVYKNDLEFHVRHTLYWQGYWRHVDSFQHHGHFC